MAGLRLINDGGAPRNELFRLTGNDVLGRSPQSQIPLKHPFVSSSHARITTGEDGYYLEDLKSVNGTFLNGKMVRRARLSPGDTIKIHQFTLVFVDEDQAPAGPPEAPRTSLRMDTATLIATRASDDLSSASGVSDPVGALRRRLQVLYSVSRAAVGGFTVESLSEAILNELFKTFSQADSAFILTPDVGNTGFSIVASRKGAEGADLAPSNTILRHACDTREAILSACALDDSRFQGSQSLVSTATTSVLCAPAAVDGEVLALIYVATRRPGRAFEKDDLQLIVCLAAVFAVALRNAKLHQEALRAQRMAAIGEAVSRLAHCIKNILNGIKGGSFIVDRGIETDDRAKILQGWDITKRNSGFLSDLVLDMLSYGKQRVPRYEATDINDLIRTVGDLYREKAASQGTTIRYDLDDALPQASVDPVSVYRCILNLVSNAVDACAQTPSSEVCLRTAAPNASGRFAVMIQDTGSGMSPEVKARLFQDFFSTKGAKGTGLGLPVVHKIIREHHGEIEVDSEVGRGTTFILRLPLAPPTDASTPPESSDEQ
ncbi:MAG: ATP-binding protein [Planctomycetota bacterium]